jgi:hypothetical protein
LLSRREAADTVRDRAAETFQRPPGVAVPLGVTGVNSLGWIESEIRSANRSLQAQIALEKGAAIEFGLRSWMKLRKRPTYLRRTDTITPLAVGDVSKVLRAAERTVAPGRGTPSLRVEGVAPVDDVAAVHHLAENLGVGVAEFGPLGEQQHHVDVAGSPNG